MVEYGNGISHGPAGQVGGGGGGAVAPGGGAHVDFFSSISHTILAQPPEVLAVGIVLVFLGLIVLRRAF